MTDVILKQNVMKTLISNYGVVQTERFISLMIKEQFDYTQWQESLFDELNVDELSSKAMMHRKSKRKIPIA